MRTVFKKDKLVSVHIRPTEDIMGPEQHPPDRLLNEGYINDNTMSALKIPKAPKKVVSTFNQEQIQCMIKAINQKTPREFRDYLIILI